MQRLQLYIEDYKGDEVLIDMFDDETIQLTSTIQDVKDIGKVFTDYSQTFSVPASETNNKVFRHFYNFNITGNAFDARKKKKAKLHINYAPFREGKIFLNSVKMKNNKAYAYEIVFYGKTVSLKDLLGDDELTDLSYLQNYNHEYNDTVVKDGFVNGLDLNGQTDSIIYPLITSKKRLFYHSGSFPFNDDTSGNLYHNASDASAIRGLEYTDLKPAIRASHIIEAIEDKYGISFTKDFFNAELEADAPYNPKSPAFYNLYMWINGVKDEFDSQDDSKIENFTFDCDGYTYDGSSDQITEATFENGIVEFTKTGSAPAYFITISTDIGTQGALFTISFTEVDSNGDKISGGDFYEINSEEYVGGTTVDGIVAMDTNVADGTVKRFKIKYSSNNPLVFDSTIELKKAPNGTLITETEKYDISSQTLSFSIDLLSTQFNVLPKMKVIDFLTGLFKMFNLTAYFIDDLNDDDYGKIYVDTLDNYYLDAVNNRLGGLIDLDKYVDSSEHTVDSVLPFTDINFNYQENDTVLMENHLEQFNEVFGDAEFNVRDGLRDPITGEIPIDRGTKYDISLPFSHFKYERLLDLNTTTYTDTRDTSIAWGYCATGDFDYTQGNSTSSPQTPPIGDYDSTTIAPLLFYAIPEQTGTLKKINWVTAPYDSAGEGISSYWRPSNSNEDGNSTTPPSYSLNFDAEVDEWQGLNYSEMEEPYEDLESQSLYYVFYRSYVESVFNPLKRMFKVKAFLPPNIVINYRLNDQIKIQDKIFRINSITTDLMTGESEIELLNIFSNEIVG